MAETKNTGAANAAPVEEDQIKLAEALQQSDSVMLERVVYPSFFGVLKQAGIVPQNQEEAQTLLHLATQVQTAKEQARVKQAAANRFSGLASELEQLGYGERQAVGTEVKYAAFDAMRNDPAIYGAALQLAEIEAKLSAQQP